MADDKDAMVSSIELHEEFVQRVERTARMIKSLSLITVFVAGVLAVSYFSQLVVLPFVLGVKSQTVDLTSPPLMATEAVVLSLTIAWFAVGMRDYFFTTRVQRQVAEIRAIQAQTAEKYGVAS